MSVQFGRWNFAGKTAAPEYLEKVSECIALYGPDSSESYSRPGIEILYRGFHTTKESRSEKQPHMCASGAVITWDGRLDNREELIEELLPCVSLEDSDVAFVGAAFERWGTDCFGKLIGDWALSIWDPRRRSLILSKDPIGPRHLYYAVEEEQITWCTVLDPLVLLAEKKFKLCEEYIAGWLSLYPATHLTPYVGIQAVSPATSVFLGPRKYIVAKYWDFDPSKRIRYRTDAEYEEHFRSVFFKAVRRRLRSDAPVLAELSGGRDSSSIVCVADDIMARGEAETPRLDTISYYDDSEPNWNERPYFTKVEERRGRVGWHVDLSGRDSPTETLFGQWPFAEWEVLPMAAYNIDAMQQIQHCLKSRCYRLLVSGIGGDESMGGIPNPIPELQDLLVGGRWRQLIHQLQRWSVEKRQPWFHLLLNAGVGLVSSTLRNNSRAMRPPTWLKSRFVNRNRLAIAGYPERVRLLGPYPSYQNKLATLNGLRRQLADRPTPSRPMHERTYPFLDRDLLEFVFSIPTEQLVRPSERRSLQRRALKGIVPTEILNRKRKASVGRTPLVDIATEWTAVLEMTRYMTCEELELFDSKLLLAALHNARRGEELSWVPLIRAIRIQRWLNNIRCVGIVDAILEQRPEYMLKSSA